MPKDAYPNKIEACRAEGAEVHLAEDRAGADVLAAELEAAGCVLIHPYDREGTVLGASTVGREIAEEWPEVEVLVICVGGGGLAAGTSLAMRRALGSDVRLFGAEPAGAPTMKLGLAAGEPVTVDPITTDIPRPLPTPAAVGSTSPSARPRSTVSSPPTTA